MGRETKILLALLGLLVGVFLGVVSLKLFVPRPPAGAGPDVHGEIATSEAQSLVEPPDFALPPTPAAARATIPAAAPAAGDPPAADPYAGRTSRFGGGGPATDRPRDPFVTQASLAASEPAGPPPMADLPPRAAPRRPAAEPAATDLLPPAATHILPPTRGLPPAPRDLPPHAYDLPPATDLLPPAAPDLPPPTRGLPPAPRDLPPPPHARLPPATAQGETYFAEPGDSWWSLAERAYGDGRLYRALFAWNRSLDPRVSLAPGTRLEIPPAARLGAAWPALLPRD